MSKRNLPRIDYTILHSDGDIVPKESVTTVQASGSSSTNPTDSAVPTSSYRISVGDSHSSTTSSELTADNEDLHSSFSDSSNESTLTPSSSDTEFDTTIVADSPSSSSSPVSPGSPNRNSTTHDTDKRLVDVLGEIDRTVNMSEDETKMLQGRINLLIDDLNDFMDENPMTDTSSTVEDVDDCIKRAEDIRTAYREMHGRLLEGLGETEYATKHKPTFEKNMLSVKNYIKLGKKRKGDIRKGKTMLDGQISLFLW